MQRPNTTVIKYCISQAMIPSRSREATSFYYTNLVFLHLWFVADCGIPMDKDRSYISDGPTTAGSTREYVCAEGTVREGNPLINCKDDFTWSESDLYCRRMYGYIDLK